MSEKPVDLDSRRNAQDRRATEIRREAARQTAPAEGAMPAVLGQAELTRRAHRVGAMAATAGLRSSPIRPFDPARDNQDTRRRARSETAFLGLYCPDEEENSCQ